MNLAQLETQPHGEIPWPTPQPNRWRELLRDAFTHDLVKDLAVIRARQAQYLRQELDRVDDCFEQ